MQIVMKGKRKAISPVLATVILIAITLIAAIAIAGFVFGLFGSFTSSAQVAASVVGCTGPAATPGNILCTITASNSGSSNTAITGTGSLHYAGIATGSQSVSCVITPANQAINAGATGVPLTSTCAIVAANGLPVSGSQFQGTFGTTNGATINFAGSFP